MSAITARHTLDYFRRLAEDDACSVAEEARYSKHAQNVSDLLAIAEIIARRAPPEIDPLTVYAVPLSGWTIRVAATLAQEEHAKK